MHPPQLPLVRWVSRYSVAVAALPPRPCSQLPRRSYDTRWSRVYHEEFLLVLTPAYAPGSLLPLIVPGGLALAVWLLVSGVNVPRWKEANAAFQ